MIDSHQLVTPELDTFFYKLYPDLHSDYWGSAQFIPIKLMFSNRMRDDIIHSLKTHDGIEDD